VTRRTETTVAAIIPAHDAAAFLPAALDSVFSQTRLPDEVIVVDDGSTDATEAVVRSHPHAARVRYLTQANAGVAAARNAGLREARAEWIAFLDADDLWLPHRLEAGLELAARRPDVRWCAGAFVERQVNGLETVRGLAPTRGARFSYGVFENLFEMFERECPFWTGTMLVHRDCLEAAGVFDPALGRREDVDLWVRIGLRFPRIGWVEKPLAVYARRADSLTHVRAPHTRLEILRLLRRRMAEVPGGGRLADPYGRWLTQQACKAWLHEDGRDDLRAALREFAEWIPARLRRGLALAAALPRPLYVLLAGLFRLRLRLHGRDLASRRRRTGLS
jgi:glycosyltransferase involved in cell wall biosynthesis